MSGNDHLPPAVTPETAGQRGSLDELCCPKIGRQKSPGCSGAVRPIVIIGRLQIGGITFGFPNPFIAAIGGLRHPVVSILADARAPRRPGS